MDVNTIRLTNLGSRPDALLGPFRMIGVSLVYHAQRLDV